MLVGSRGAVSTPARKAKEIWIEELKEIINSADYLVNRDCKGATDKEKEQVLSKLLEILERVKG